jgi:protoheme IX farnesyltransferase
LPPVIGWCLAGGAPDDYRIMLLAGLLYLWQIPHFWLFQRRHADDYRRAGLPLLATPSMGSTLFWLWIIALTAAAMLLPAFGVIGRQTAVSCLLFPLPLIFIALFRSETALFSYLNLFPLMVTLLLLAQKY